MSDQLALMAHEGTGSGAVVSPCGRYRYRLWRRVVSHHAHHVKDRIALFIMLNPSTADAMLDDPTIRRCIGFAAREGCGWLHVVNLYAYRATDPRALVSAGDPVGPENDASIAAAIAEACASGGYVLAAWGVYPRAAARVETVRAICRSLGGDALYCLGTSAAGHPRHPLYLRADARVAIWNPSPWTPGVQTAAARMARAGR